MPISLRPLHKQVILITGATSGVGLATVKSAVEQGAKIFMVARNEEELQGIQDQMRHNAYDTAFAVAEEAEAEQLQYAADRCIATFGRIDTWVNTADISVFGKILDTTEEEAKRLFDTNFWGIVNGSKVAVTYLSEKGGALINISSTLTKVSPQIEGIHLASRMAVKAYTDSLRKELHQKNIPISVSFIAPFSNNVSYPPENVARLILKSAMKPVKESVVGKPPLSLLGVLRSAFNLESVPRSQQLYQTIYEGWSNGPTEGIFDDPKLKRAPSSLSAHKTHRWPMKALTLGGVSLLVLKKMRIL